MMSDYDRKNEIKIEQREFKRHFIENDSLIGQPVSDILERQQIEALTKYFIQLFNPETKLSEKLTVFKK